jgi:hypothetical protein
MDAELLDQMARVYTTDRGCSAAVKRLEAERGLSFVEAAQQAAKTVVPAPHNYAAHDARLLLAPETVEDADAILNKELRGPAQGDAEFVREAEEDRREDEHDRHEGRGPIPAHPDEAPDDRQTFVQIEEIDDATYRRLSEINPLAHGKATDCGPLCELSIRLSNEIERVGRVPVRPPTLSVRQARGEEPGEVRWRLRLSADTVPARGRGAWIFTGWGTPDEIEAAVQKMLRDLEARPEWRLVVRRDPRQSWATAAVYRPVDPVDPVDYVLVRAFSFGDGPEEVRALIDALFGGEAEIPVEIGSDGAIMLSMRSGDADSVPDG